MDTQKKLTKYAHDLLSLVGLEADIAVTLEDEETFQVSIKTPSAGALIGYHGRTLLSLEHLLRSFLFQVFNKWYLVNVDVDGYQEKRHKVITRLASLAVIKAKSLGKPVSLPPMPAHERRVVHLFLANNPDVSSESEGEGNNRQVVVAPRVTENEPTKG